jgi:hypothetical protein
MVCSSSSRIAPRTVAAMGIPPVLWGWPMKASGLMDRHRAFTIIRIATMYWTLYDGLRYDKWQEVPQ